MSEPSGRGPAFLFDLDGTLVDSVYQHVLAWREALEEGGIELAVWRIHRQIGMSGGLFVNALLRETGFRVTAEQAAHLQRFHARLQARAAGPRPARRARAARLLTSRRPMGDRHQRRIESARRCWIARVADEVPVVTRDQVRLPSRPDLFLAAAARLGVDITHSMSSATASGLRRAPARALGIGCSRAATAARARARRGLPRLPGPGRPPAPPRRGRRQATEEWTNSYPTQSMSPRRRQSGANSREVAHQLPFSWRDRRPSAA